MRFLTKNRSPLLRREMKLEKIGGALCDRRGWLEALLLCLWFKTNMYPKFSVEDKKNSSYSKDGAVKSQLSLFIVELLSCVCSKLFSLHFSVLNFRFTQHVFTNREGQTNCSAVAQRWHLPTMYFEVLLRGITDALQTSTQGLSFVVFLGSLPERKRTYEKLCFFL